MQAVPVIQLPLPDQPTPPHWLYFAIDPAAAEVVLAGAALDVDVFVRLVVVVTGLLVDVDLPLIVDVEALTVVVPPEFPVLTSNITLSRPLISYLYHSDGDKVGLTISRSPSVALTDAPDPVLPLYSSL